MTAITLSKMVGISNYYQQYIMVDPIENNDISTVLLMQTRCDLQGQ